MESIDKISKAKQANSTVDWDAVTKVFDKTSRENLMQKISDIVLQTKSRITPNVLDKYIDKDARDTYIKTTIIELMSTPEYQLC
jgi:Zn-dependent M32 family carboxypeptidase